MVSKEIIVNGDPRETRIAVREDGKLVELHIERGERVVGSIFKGRVDNVVAGQDAAFVDIGLERNAYLAAGDIVSPGDLDEDDSFDRRGRRPRPTVPIKNLVRRNQEVLVQVIKGPRGTKGSRVSTRISLPGRYLVFMPDENSTGVSRKIDDPKERDRLKRIVEGIRHPGYGLIVRTEAEGKTERELRQDLEYLEQTWATVKQSADSVRAPALVYQDLTLLFRILRDAFGSDVDRLILDNPEDYKKAHELLDFFGPSLKDRVVLFDSHIPIFDHFHIEQEMHQQLRRRVPLKSGGYLIIDQTEALVAIDVNSGKFGGKTEGLSDTIVQTNLEAVNEIARQLRLRDMGGILVLDLIDMNNATDRRKVEVALEAAFKTDKNRCKVSHISPLGLIEMTRKRTGETVNEQMDVPCPYCSGTGRVQSPESVAFTIQREIRRQAKTNTAEAFHVTCHPLVAAALVGDGGDDIEQLEHFIERGVYIRSTTDIHMEKYDIQPGSMDDFDRRLATFRPGQSVDARIVSVGDTPTSTAAGITETGLVIHFQQGSRQLGQSVRLKVTGTGRSSATGEILNRDRVNDNQPRPHVAPTSEGAMTSRSSDGQNRRRRRRGPRETS